MYTITIENNIRRIKILGPTNFKNRVRVSFILSPEDEIKSFWGQIVSNIHKSQIFKTEEAAKKEQFIRKLSSWH